MVVEILSEGEIDFYRQIQNESGLPQLPLVIHPDYYDQKMYMFKNTILNNDQGASAFLHHFNKQQPD